MTTPTQPGRLRSGVIAVAAAPTRGAADKRHAVFMTTQTRLRTKAHFSSPVIAG